jgi:GNAT superfamily N-acetyltransferase
MSGLDLSPPAPIEEWHFLDAFESGEPSLDEWLKRRALRNHASGASRVFVLSSEKTVVGYYCLSASAIAHAVSPKSMRRNMPDPLPALLLGRLAIDRRHHNKGLGAALLRDAMLRSLNIGKDTGVFAVLVHALSESARQFYLSRGFAESPVQPMTLMMTLATMRGILPEGRGKQTAGASPRPSTSR